ncbi:MAG: replication-associated recombination protein A [Planctomycetes bacterium]|nr:replication-associated recombination protein A [Planctomycetota bacterium]
MGLFEPPEDRADDIGPLTPLAARMRPRTPEEFVGQEHFFGEGKLLRRMLDADRLMSVIFYGPPGSGKTALAHVIANTTKAHFEQVNAAASSVKEVRDIIHGAQRRQSAKGRRTVLFVDELHRFNRSQQDVLLPDVERGVVILVGATTHNPFFAINSPLLSRSQIFKFEPLSREDIKTIVHRAATDPERGLGEYKIELRDDALDHLAEVSDGDARRALNALEVGVLSTEPNAEGVIVFDVPLAEESIQRKVIEYDRNEDQHYDTASAFIKSMRGSDPDAALYWMAKMLEAGEDPRFVARRMVICAAEDVGNAAPLALVLANAAFQVADFVGMPEAKIPLAQAVTYIACAPKSNAAYMAIEKALGDVRDGRTLSVPKHLRDTHYKGAKRLGHGEGYKYAHDYDGHWVDQEYIPCDNIYYEPTEEGSEKTIKERLDQWRKERRERKSQGE